MPSHKWGNTYPRITPMSELWQTGILCTINDHEEAKLTKVQAEEIKLLRACLKYWRDFGFEKAMDAGCMCVINPKEDHALDKFYKDRKMDVSTW